MGRMTISNTASLWSPADYSGTLYKRAGGCRPGWKKRFFVLKGCSLFYFNSAEDFSPRGVIPIEQATVAEGKRTQGVIDRRDKYIISITVHHSFQCSKEVYLLSARSSSGQEDWLQVLQSVTVPHADLAARISKLSIAEVKEAKKEVESERKDVSCDTNGDDEAVGGDSDSEDEPETEMAPDPSGNGALDIASGKKPAERSVKKAFRFASNSTIEQQLEEEPKEEKKKFKKPKGSVYIKKSDAFDFHGEELTEEDAAALADIEKEEEPKPVSNAVPATTAEPHTQDTGSAVAATGPPGFRPKAATYSHPTAGATQARAIDLHAFNAQQAPPMPPVAPSPLTPQTPSPRDIRVMSSAEQHAQHVPHSIPPPSRSPEVQVAGGSGNGDYRSMAHSMAPFDWGDSGSPRITTFMTAAQQQQQQQQQQLYDQQMQQPQRPSAADPDMLPLPPVEAEMMRQHVMSMHAAAGDAQSMRAVAMQSMAPADWGTDGLPRFSAYARPSDAVAAIGAGGPVATPHHPGSPQAAEQAELADARASAASIRAAAAQSLALADWSMVGLPPRGTTRMSAAPLSHPLSHMHAPYGGGTSGAAELPHMQPQQQEQEPPVSPQVAQLQAEQHMLQQQLAARQSQIDALAHAHAQQHAHEQQAQHLMHAAQPAHTEQQIQRQSQQHTGMQQAGPQDPSTAAPFPPTPDVSSQNGEAVSAAQLSEQDRHSMAASEAPPPHAPSTPTQSPSLDPPSHQVSPPNLQPHALPDREHSAAHLAQPAPQPAPQPHVEHVSGSTMLDFTRTLDDLKGTVASMQQSLQHSPTGTRSPSPSHERAAAALARARETLRTVSAFRNPGGHGKSTHARTATFDVADFSRAQAPADGHARLARNATMDNPRALTAPLPPHQQPPQFFSQQPLPPQGFQSPPLHWAHGMHAGMMHPLEAAQHTAPGGSQAGGRLEGPEQLRGNISAYAAPRMSSPAADQPSKMALQQQHMAGLPAGGHSIRAHALPASNSFNSTAR